MNLKKKNVILVSPSLWEPTEEGWAPPYPKVPPYPFAAVMLFGTILKKSGYDIKIIDGNLYDVNEWIDEINNAVNNDTVCIGFSVMTNQVPLAYKVTKEIKNKFPDLCIIWGGFHPTLFPEQTVSDNNVDIVVVNEATQTITQLVNTLTNGGDLTKIPGLYFKSRGKIVKTSKYVPDDLSKLPFFDFSLIDSDRYSKNSFVFTEYLSQQGEIIFFPILTGMGCVNKCRFCINVILNRKYRFKSAEDIVDRIEYLQKNYNANSFWFIDEDFFLNKKRLLQFLDLIEKRNLHFYWRASLRVNYFNDDYITVNLAKRLEKNGLVIAVMGAECGSQRMLDYINKGINVENTLRSAEVLSKTDILAKYSFIVGLPSETKEDLRDTYRLVLKIAKIKKNHDLVIFPFRPYPGSPIYEDAKEKYTIYEPSKLEDWANNEDYSEASGYITYKKNSWFPDYKEYEQLKFIKAHFFGFINRKGLIARFFRYIVSIRFKFNFFNFLYFEKFCVMIAAFLAKRRRKNQLEIEYDTGMVIE